MNFQSGTVLGLFEENELNISRLYRIYSQKIAGHKKFWEQLAKEEIQHALEIRNAYDGKKDVFEENKFARGAIKYVFDFVQSGIDEARDEKPSHAKALEIALRIEQSFLEKKCFEIFIPNKKTVENVLLKLNKETQEHIERLRKELKRIEGKKKK